MRMEMGARFVAAVIGAPFKPSNNEQRKSEFPFRICTSTSATKRTHNSLRQWYSLTATTTTAAVTAVAVTTLSYT